MYAAFLGISRALILIFLRSRPKTTAEEISRSGTPYGLSVGAKNLSPAVRANDDSPLQTMIVSQKVVARRLCKKAKIKACAIFEELSVLSVREFLRKSRVTQILAF